MKEFLTTKEVAELLGVSLPSIINWANAGKLKVFRTPGGHRRIRYPDVVLFSQRYGYPLGKEVHVSETASTSVLLIDSDQEYRDTLKEFLEESSSVEVLACGNLFKGGVEFERWSPRVVVIDSQLLASDPHSLEEFMRSDLTGQQRRHLCQFFSLTSLPTRRLRHQNAINESVLVTLCRTSPIQEIVGQILNVFSRAAK